MSRKNSNNYTRVRYSSNIWRVIRPILIILISVGVIAFIGYKGINYVNEHYLLPVDPNLDREITVEIENGLGKSGIAEVLYGDDENNRIIRAPLTFKIYVDFVGKGNKLRAGTYNLSPGMTIPQIVNKLASGDGSIQVVQQFTATEGMTIENVADVLVKNQIIPSRDEFLKLAKTGDSFPNIISTFETKTGRIYALEGYLFPDTYKVHEGVSALDIIEMMTARLPDVLSRDYHERAEVIELSMDEVIILASIIEKEAKTDDFAKVSAVLHNRIAAGMRLECDSTIKYSLNAYEIYLSQAQISEESLYSTHTRDGLPIGPICNPGQKAIEAALWPDEEYVKDGYLFFTLTDPAEGKSAFTKTFEEHAAIVAQYKDLWIAYDRATKAENDSQPSSPISQPDSDS